MGKIVALTKLKVFINTLSKNKVSVLATGAFDILHVEHVRFLKKAKEHGDILIVGVDPDISIRRIKGKGRPVNSQYDRADVVSALKCVDYVFILPEDLDKRDGREGLIRLIKPDIYAVSRSSPFLPEKRRVMKKFGGKVIVVREFNPGISSSAILEKLFKE